MRSTNHAHEPESVKSLRGAPEARAERHASRAGTTFARFVRNLAAVGGYTIHEAERHAVAVIATLEERIPIREVCNLEAQLPRRLDELLSFVPLNGLPAMDRMQFIERVSARAHVTYAEAETIARTVFGFLRSQISEGEVRHVEARLPEGLRELWKEPPLR
jgi:uncharacterized protein (DUF2267 family)